MLGGGDMVQVFVDQANASLLFEPPVVRVSGGDLALPPGHATPAGLEHVHVAVAHRFVHAGAKLVFREGFSSLVEGAGVGGNVRRVVAEENTKGCLACRRGLCGRDGFVEHR